MDKEKRLGILGAGPVGIWLANGLRDKGYKIAIGNRKGNVVDGWTGEVGTYAEISASADTVLLVVNGLAAEEVITGIKDNLANKLVIDATNPINAAPPDEGVLDFFTTLHDSLMERLQAIAPQAKFVKAFNAVGHKLMIDPSFEGGKPTMFICGNDDSAKDKVTAFLTSLGWDTEDFGGVKSARAIEPLCMLWCIPLKTRGEANHAFRLLKA